MADVRLSVDQAFMDELKSKTGVDKASQLTADALNLFSWAVSEVKKGRVLISMDENGLNPKKVVTPTLEKARLIK